jgi:ribose 5-phosphate isomerase B
MTVGFSKRVGLAADHGGFGLKQELAAQLRTMGYEVVDFGAHALDPEDDYPDFVIPLARAVAAGKVERGIAICGSGVGAAVCANKVPGIRASLVHDHFSARQGVEDDHVNIICMSGRTVGPAVAWDLVETFLAAMTRSRGPHFQSWHWVHPRNLPPPCGFFFSCFPDWSLLFTRL